MNGDCPISLLLYRASGRGLALLQTGDGRKKGVWLAKQEGMIKEEMIEEPFTIQMIFF